jgi:O-antigen/teichoic acid export membrane protein
MDSKKQIKNGAVISYIAIISNIIASFLYTPWMVRSIGKSDYGLYTLAVSLITIFLMDFGIGSVVTRFASKYRVDNDTKSINNLLGIVFKLFIVIDIVILVILSITYFRLGDIYIGLENIELQKFKVLYLIIASFSVISFPFTILNGIFNAYEYFVQLKLCDLLQKLSTIAFIIFALLRGYGVITIVAINTLTGIITIIIKLYLLKHYTPIKVNFKCKSKTLLREMFDFSIWVTIIVIAQRLTYNLAPSILGIASTSYEIAIYSPAAAIAGYFYTFAIAIDGLFLPTIFRKIAEKKAQDILSIMIKVGRFQITILGLIFVGLVCVGKEFITLWMGEEYIKSYNCTILLILPAIFEYSQQIARLTVVAENKVKLQSIGLISTSIINVPISLLLSYYYGAVGVSIAICITGFLNLFYMNLMYNKVLKFNMFQFYKICYLRMIIPIGGTIVLASAVLYYIEQNGWLWLMVKGFIVAVIFGILTFLFNTNKEERSKLVSIIRKLDVRKNVN